MSRLGYESHAQSRLISRTIRPVRIDTSPRAVIPVHRLEVEAVGRISFAIRIARALRILCVRRRLRLGADPWAATHAAVYLLHTPCRIVVAEVRCAVAEALTVECVSAFPDHALEYGEHTVHWSIGRV